MEDNPHSMANDICDILKQIAWILNQNQINSGVFEQLKTSLKIKNSIYFTEIIVIPKELYLIYLN